MKSTLMKLAHALSTLLLFVGATNAAFGQANRYTLHLHNSSGYDIYEIHLSPSDDSDWHRDLLGDDILDSPGSFNVKDIAAGEYDLLLVDEDGDTCVRTNVQFFRNRNINITSDWLLGCEFHNSVSRGAE